MVRIKFATCIIACPYADKDNFAFKSNGLAVRPEKIPIYEKMANL